MRSDAFRRAAEDRDLDATIAEMSPAVVLRSPVASEPFHGTDAIRRLFAILYEVWDELEFIGPAYASEDGGEILHFRWRIGEHEAEGVDMLRFDDAGLIVDYRVMVRPFAALDVMRERIFARLAAEPAS
jgi:hypothetical protein